MTATAFLPREHGAYGQVTFPPLTAFLVAGASAAGLLITLSVVAAFLAHEPAAVLLGQRGARARRETGPRAWRWFGAWVVISAAAGVAAVLLLPPAARPWLAVPLVPAVFLAMTTIRGTEKSWGGEVAAALAFGGTAVPIVVSAGESARTAFAVAIPFVLLFIAGTLAVRVVILRVRGGGNPRAARATRLSAFAVCGAAVAALVAAAAADLLPAATVAAAAPGLLTATVVAASPPPPARLRRLGWTLVAASVVTAMVTVLAAF